VGGCESYRISYTAGGGTRVVSGGIKKGKTEGKNTIIVVLPVPTPPYMYTPLIFWFSSSSSPLTFLSRFGNIDPKKDPSANE